MSTTQPLKNIDEIEELKRYFLRRGEIRNYVLVTLGINTALRISDLLQVVWKDVYDFRFERVRQHMTVIEHKTGKTANIYLNHHCAEALEMLKTHLKREIQDCEYVFRSRVGANKPISRNRAYVIIKNACLELGYEGTLSCHSLRKTFGYHAWKQGTSPAVLMSIYNHSSMKITMRYLSIEQDDKDDVYRAVML